MKLVKRLVLLQDYRLVYSPGSVCFLFVFQSPRLLRKEKLCKKVSDTSTCSLPASSITSLILIIHGGTQIDTGLDPTSRAMDFKLLQDAFEAVINSHYKGAVGRIVLRLVECPAICSKALNLLSQLCPYSESDSGKSWVAINKSRNANRRRENQQSKGQFILVNLLTIRHQALSHEGGKLSWSASLSLDYIVMTPFSPFKGKWTIFLFV